MPSNLPPEEAPIHRFEQAVKSLGHREPLETPRDRLWTAVYVLMGLVLILIAGLILNHFLTQADINNAKQDQLSSQTITRTKGFQNRAAICEVGSALGVQYPPNDVCKDPDIQQYIHPVTYIGNSASAIRVRDLLCKVLTDLHDPASQEPQCTQVLMPGGG